VTAIKGREVYRTYRRSKGFSDYRDAGSNPVDWDRETDGHCWWCAQPVKRTLHDYAACHDGMFETVVQYRRKPRPEPTEEPSMQQALEV
jgi:hypothetical protein